MAVRLLSHDVSDLCIGKPAVKSLPTTATVGEAIVALKLTGETYISIVNSEKNKKGTIAGKICMVDIICYLCSESNIAAPSAALKNPVLELVSKEEGSVQQVEPDSSILKALDAILDGGAASLVVPIHSGTKKTLQSDTCWLTQEDLIRFFLNSISHFSSIAHLSVTSLDLVRPAVLSIRHRDPAISALSLLRSAITDQTSVAVLTNDNKLIGEISPSTLSSCDHTVVAAIASLSAGDLMTYIDCSSGGTLTESIIQAVRERLNRKGNMEGMLELLDVELLQSLSSGSSASSLSSSDDEAEVTERRKKHRRNKSSGSYSARMRRSEEAIICHPESSLVAVMVQGLAHRVSYVWVVDEEDYGLVGVVSFRDVLRVFREQLHQHSR